MTGIPFDADASFANSEQTPQQKLALLAAANDFSHLLYGYRETEEDFVQLGRLGKIQDLTDLHDEKLPNVVELFCTDPIMRERYLGDLVMELMGGRLYFVRMSMGKAIFQHDYGNDMTLEEMVGVGQHLSVPGLAGSRGIRQVAEGIRGPAHSVFRPGYRRAVRTGVAEAPGCCAGDRTHARYS